MAVSRVLLRRRSLWHVRHMLAFLCWSALVQCVHCGFCRSNGFRLQPSPIHLPFPAPRSDRSARLMLAQGPSCRSRGGGFKIASGVGVRKAKLVFLRV